MPKARLAPKFEIRQYVKAYYHYKRLLAVDKYLRTAYQCATRLAKMKTDNPQQFARLEANYQANQLEKD